MGKILLRKQLMKKQITGLIFVLTSLLFQCAAPTGLTPVSGVEGQISIPDSTFASAEITAVVLGVLDRLDLDNIADHLIAYSEPILPCDVTASDCDPLTEFFIQLKPGGYQIIPVGLTIPPETFIVKIDSVLNAPHLPVKLPGTEIIDILLNSKSILIHEQQITKIDDLWEIEF